MKNHLFSFASEAAAKADPVIGPYHVDAVPGENPDMWRPDVCDPNESVYIGATLQSGFWMIVGSDNSDAALAQHASCRLAWDPESAVILGGTWTGNDMAQVYVSPVPAGSYNPWNGSAPS